MNDIQNILSINLLSICRINADISFLSKLISGKINCSPFLKRIYLNVPQYNSLINSSFYTKTHHTNYGYNNPLERILRLGNESVLDFFHY
jgi:hypothetical protein